MATLILVNFILSQFDKMLQIMNKLRFWVIPYYVKVSISKLEYF